MEEVSHDVVPVGGRKIKNRSSERRVFQDNIDILYTMFNGNALL